VKALSLILSIGGLLVALVASIGLLVVAFRVSIGWFIVCFLPFGKLVFSLVHWSEARGAVTAYFVGVVIVLAGFAIAPDIYRQTDNRSSPRVVRPEKSGTAPTPFVPVNTVVSREERITVLQARLAQGSADLNALYRELSARRAALKPGDEKALADYNGEAARYAAKLESTRKDKAELDDLMAKLH
jgi:hypothetical protein